MIVYTDKKQQSFEIDEEDYESVRRYVWYLSIYPCTMVKTYHSYNGIDYTDRTVLRLHVFLCGSAPKPFEWDHIDRNKLNNKRSNLRLVTRSQNMFNVETVRGISGVKGIWTNGDHWWVVVPGDSHPENICVAVGNFLKLEDAIAAQKSAIAKLKDPL